MSAMRGFWNDVVGPAPAAGSRPKPSISVSGKDHDGSTADFTVTGSGFSPNATVFIRAADDQANQVGQQQSADANGGLNALFNVACVNGATIHFSATDNTPDPSDVTGVLWSNTFNIPCPCPAASAPDASAPDASAPDASAPDASAPDAPAPDAPAADAPPS